MSQAQGCHLRSQQRYQQQQCWQQQQRQQQQLGLCWLCKKCHLRGGFAAAHAVPLTQPAKSKLLLPLLLLLLLPTLLLLLLMPLLTSKMATLGRAPVDIGSRGRRTPLPMPFWPRMVTKLNATGRQPQEIHQHFKPDRSRHLPEAGGDFLSDLFFKGACRKFRPPGSDQGATAIL